MNAPSPSAEIPEPAIGALDHILGQLGLPDHEQAYSREDLLAARLEVAALRRRAEEAERLLIEAEDLLIGSYYGQTKPENVERFFKKLPVARAAREEARDGR